jgi:hypothetical protein
VYFTKLVFVIYLISSYIMDVKYQYRPHHLGPEDDFASKSAAEVVAAYTKRAPKEPCRVGSPFNIVIRGSE